MRPKLPLAVSWRVLRKHAKDHPDDRLVIAVVWTDACGHHGYDASGLIRMATVGTLYEITDEYVTTGQDVDEAGKFRTTCSVPRVNVEALICFGVLPVIEPHE